MNNQISRKNDHLEPEFPSNLELPNRADAAGLWFAAAVLFAVLAAGVIIYRAGGSDDLRTAANDQPPAASQGDPLSPSILLRR